MTISGFTPISALVGGSLIGLSTGLMILLLGRIGGVSGILAGLLPPARKDWNWRLAFVLGLPFGVLLYGALAGAPDFEITSSTPLLIGAGLLVGLGTRLGSGCTSGHGVCGLARRSRRSLVATATFMGCAMLTVWIVRHLLGGV